MRIATDFVTGINNELANSQAIIRKAIVNLRKIPEAQIIVDNMQKELEAEFSVSKEIIKKAIADSEKLISQ